MSRLPNHPSALRGAVDDPRDVGFGGDGQTGLVEAEGVLKSVFAHSLCVDQCDGHGDRSARWSHRAHDDVQCRALVEVVQPTATGNGHVDDHGADGQLPPVPLLLLLGNRPGLCPFGGHRAPFGVDRIVGRGLCADDQPGSDLRIHRERQPHGRGAPIADLGRGEILQRFFDVPAPSHDRGVVEAVALGRILLEDPLGLGIRCPGEQHPDRVRGDRRILGQNLVGGAGAEQVPAQLLDETFPQCVVGGVRAGPVRHPAMPSCVMRAVRL